MMRNKIAVLLPVYHKDRLPLFQLAIESVLEQTYQFFDIYVLVDGEISKKMNDYLLNRQKKDKRIIVIRSQKCRGLARNLNNGIKVIKSDYDFIARMDSDDICLPTRFEKQIMYLEKYKNIDLIGCPAYIIDEENKTIGLKKIKTKLSFHSVLKKCEIVHPSVMLRGDFFEKYGVYNPDYIKSQDYELWLRALNLGALMRNLNTPLIKFRYEREIIQRRKKEQDFNIKIKKKYIRGVQLYVSIIPNILIKYLPTAVLKKIVKNSING